MKQSMGGSNRKKSVEKDDEDGEDQEDDNDDEDEEEDEQRRDRNQLAEGGDTDDDEALLDEEMSGKVGAMRANIGNKRKAVSKSQLVMEEADAKDELERTSVDKFSLMNELTSFLLPGENVLQAIKRMSGKNQAPVKTSSYSASEVN